MATFAGGAVNRLLAAGLEVRSGERWTARQPVATLQEPGNRGRRRGHRLPRSPRLARMAAAAARGMARGLLSKFQPCLPQEAEDRLLVERLLDVAGTVRFPGEREGGAGHVRST